MILNNIVKADEVLEIHTIRIGAEIQKLYEIK